MSVRDIPSIERLRQRPVFQALEARFGRSAVVDALREAAAALRDDLMEAASAIDIPSAMEQAVTARLEDTYVSTLVPVINATGVIIHTNLGRAPLAHAAAARVASLATRYTNLEYDVAGGHRSSRHIHAERLLTRVTGADAAVIVNNNAAATLITLAALAAGREVIISRGELVEIGGGFRVPDVMAQSGAVLREVGTTNRTRVADYAAAISERTAAILRVHPSNFTIAGFTERPALEDLVALARRFNIPVLEDLGSGLLDERTDVAALRDEPTARGSIAAGVTVVMFSADKLLGGPQAGVIAGATHAISQVSTHPLMRALRADKMTYAALQATLEEYASGRAQETIPVARMMALPVDAIAPRAEALAAALAAAGLIVEVVDGVSTIGGGSAPGSQLPTRLVAITLPAEQFESSLRTQSPAVIARIDRDRVVLDLRTVPAEDDALLAQLVTRAAAGTRRANP